MRSDAALGPEIGQNALKSAADHEIHQREKQSQQNGHEKNHNRRKNHLTAGRPDDFADFSAGLLDELDRIGPGHINYLSSIRGDIRNTVSLFKSARHPTCDEARPM